MDPLGVPWHPVEIKGQDFAPSVTYVGFLWDIQDQSVLLLTKKWLKYLDKIRAIQSFMKLMVSCKEVMSIHGMLQHITFVYRQGHSSLPPLLEFIAKFPNNYAHHVPRSIHKCMTLWESLLQNPNNSYSLLP